jgi:hypothetical protein
MEIFGYSERGMINSLFYEMKFSQKNLQLLNDFLSLVSFPDPSVNFKISDAKILIEQSFSDFGDADAVLLLNNEENKQVSFIEAKVKTSQGKWSIYDEFEKFKRGVPKSEPPKGFSSNLFVQLYFKNRLIETLKSGVITQLQEGLQFPVCLLKKDRKTHGRSIPRKIGNNKVVLNAVEQLKEYCKDALFISLVPEDVSNLRNFYQDTLKNYRPKGFQGWDIRNWGYVSWAQVEEFCKKYSLKGTLRIFEFNEGQIYNISTSAEKNICFQKWSKEKAFELMNKLNERQIRLMEILVEGGGKEKHGIIMKKLGHLGGKGSLSSLQKIKVWINRKSICGKILPDGYGPGENRIHKIESTAYEWVKEWFKKGMIEHNNE